MSEPNNTVEYNLEALERESGVSSRTIRYYISQGLVQAPLKVGCSATYGAQHLVTLRRITELKKQGLALDAIRKQLDPRNPTPLPPMVTWHICQPTENVAVFIRANVPPWERHKIDKALVPFVAAVTRNDASEEG